MQRQKFFGCAILTVLLFGSTFLLFGCASLPQSQALRQVRIGMTKSEVLSLVGSPKLSDRRLNQDRWIYETDDEPDHHTVTTYIFFAHNRVTYVGAPNKPAAPKSTSSQFQPVDQ